MRYTQGADKMIVGELRYPHEVRVEALGLT